MEEKAVERLLPLLVDLHDGLSEEVSLRLLAEKFGTSAFHFHRLFTNVVGETPKKHIERVRLERAAMLLAVSDAPVLEIGLSVGFKNAETFSRRFKKFLGLAPSEYRRMAKAAQAARVASVDFFRSAEYTLGPARFERLPTMTLLAMRHLGDYGALHETYSGDSSPWNALTDWATSEDMRLGALRIGIFYDDPTLTPSALQRADICLPCERSDRSLSGKRVRCIDFPGGMHAVLEYVGGTSTVIDAFRGLADEIRRSSTFDFAEGPPLELIRELDVGGQAGLHRFDVCFPVKRKRKRSG